MRNIEKVKIYDMVASLYRLASASDERLATMGKAFSHDGRGVFAGTDILQAAEHYLDNPDCMKPCAYCGNGDTIGSADMGRVCADCHKKHGMVSVIM